MNRRPKQGGGGDEYAAHVQGILNRVSELEAQIDEQKGNPRSGSLLTSTPVVGFVALIFGAVVMWNIQSFKSVGGPLPPGARESSLQVSAMVMTAAVESYKETHGRLPTSLNELGLPPSALEEIQYVARGGDFHIVTSMGGTQVRYRSEKGAASLLEQVTTTDRRSP